MTNCIHQIQYSFWTTVPFTFQNQFTDYLLTHNNAEPVKLTTWLPIKAQLTNTAAATKRWKKRIFLGMALARLKARFIWNWGTSSWFIQSTDHHHTEMNFSQSQQYGPFLPTTSNHPQSYPLLPTTHRLTQYFQPPSVLPTTSNHQTKTKAYISTFYHFFSTTAELPLIKFQLNLQNNK